MGHFLSTPFFGLTRAGLRTPVAAEPLVLSNLTAVDGSPAGALVGLLSGGVGVYALIDDAGGRFRIVGDELQAASFDLAAASYDVTVASGLQSATFTITVQRATVSQALAAAAEMSGFAVVGCLDPNSGLAVTAGNATTWVDRVSGTSFTAIGAIAVQASHTVIGNRVVVGDGTVYFEEANNSSGHTLDDSFIVDGAQGEIDAVCSNQTGTTTNRAVFAYGSSTSNGYRLIGKAASANVNRARVLIGGISALDTATTFDNVGSTLQARFSGGAAAGAGLLEGWLGGSPFTPPSQGGGTLTTSKTAARARIMSHVGGNTPSQQWIGPVGPIFRFSGQRSAAQRAFFARVGAAYIAGLDQSATDYNMGSAVGVGPLWPTSGIWPSSGNFGA